jgi:glycerol-3-phosphate dehydrogenase subunit B
MIDISCDVMVIGAGHAGMAAALFAAQKGLSVAQAGTTGGIDFGSGFIDVLGVHPTAKLLEHDDPWSAMDSLRREIPDHPYTRLKTDEIKESLREFIAFLDAQGLPYGGDGQSNLRLPTPAGTVKRTCRAPQTMIPGADALASKAPCLAVAFDGLKGFSGHQLTETLGRHWPALKSATIRFPGLDGELFPEHMALALSDAKRREALAEAVRPHLGDAQYVAFPAMLGILDCTKITTHLSQLLGATVFEIPTLPPPIMGTRLRAAFDRGLPALGVRTLSQKTVRGTQKHPSGGFTFTVGGARDEYRVSARSAILATGRFFGKGLRQEMHGIRETVFDIPVAQPSGPDEWYSQEFFDPKGHPADRSGVRFDSSFRPLGPDGQVYHQNLRAAGAILCGHDWIREKCGTGLAVATAWKAVQSLTEQLEGGN